LIPEYFILPVCPTFIWQDDKLSRNDSNLPDYSEFVKTLQRHSIEASPAEAQGVIAAVLCLPQPDQADWLELFLSSESATIPEPDPELSGALLSLFQTTREQLFEDGFEFTLYLPTETPLSRRASAVAAWCRGFLLGISAGHLTAANSSDLLREILSDMVDISGAESGPEESEEEERALMEIEEYLKAAVHLVREEMAYAGGDALPDQPDA
jgi:yecA family protein